MSLKAQAAVQKAKLEHLSLARDMLEEDKMRSEERERSRAEERRRIKMAEFMTEMATLTEEERESLKKRLEVIAPPTPTRAD